LCGLGGGSPIKYFNVLIPQTRQNRRGTNLRDYLDFIELNITHEMQGQSSLSSELYLAHAIILVQSFSAVAFKMVQL